MAKTYSREVLIRFVNRADTWEKLDIARDFIDKLDLPEDLREELDMELFLQGDAINDAEYGYGCLARDDDDYSPSSPWNAPGMRVSDFITGVSYF